MKERPTGVHMSDDEMNRVEPADKAAFASPVPTQIVSNGEYNPLPQTKQQRQVEDLIKEMAGVQAKKHNMSRRRFLTTASGMATAFAAMNTVFGKVFDDSDAHAKAFDLAEDRAQRLRDQFIFDVQTHFIRDDFAQEGLTGLRKWAIGSGVNRDIADEATTLSKFKFDNYVKEIFLESDTKVTILSGAVFDDPSWNLLGNQSIRDACDSINKIAGATRMHGHFVIKPTYDGWMDEVDDAIENMRPVSWKAYTIGDPFGPSKHSWRLDDEELMYPFYEKAIASGINTICIHKGLMPRDYEKAFAGTWESATVNDLGKAAKDFPGMNFVIYHSALRPWLSDEPAGEMQSFMDSDYIPWSTDLANIPEKFGVNNVYAEIGTSFASSAVTNPRFCAAFLGQLVNIMGSDRVLYGSDSVWYGSPQWQIEALRRLEIPDDIMSVKGWQTPLGDENSEVKRKLFGLNAAQLYRLKIQLGDIGRFNTEQIAQARAEYTAAGLERSNQAYGYVAKRA